MLKSASEESDALLERMMTLHPKVIDLTLDRMHRLLAKLGNPEQDLPPVVHVAGTNGKGSTLAMIRAGIEAAGQTTHCYTSPHLERFHERIRVAGTLIEEDQLTRVLDECLGTNGPDAITYFEITTAAALLSFARSSADWTLLEVGLGGRLDATNVIDEPALTVITRIDLDHQQFLGETLQEIAFEKAGILKPGVPCVVARQSPEAMDVIGAQAERTGAPLLVAGRDWDVYRERDRLIFQDERGLCDLPLPALAGPHQTGNAGNAIAALRQLGFDHAALEGAVSNAEWPARMQRIRTGPLADAAGPHELWLDGGHNPAAGQAIARSFEDLPDLPLRVICGMLMTKDASGFLEHLAPLTERLLAVDVPGVTATAPSDEVAESARQLGIDAATSPSVHAAIADLRAQSPRGRILICGSLYLAGHVLRQNRTD